MDVVECVLYYIKDVFAILSIVYILKVVFSCEKRKGKVGMIISLGFPLIYCLLSLIFLVPSVGYTYELLDAVSNFFYIAAVFLCLKKPPALRSIAVIFIYIFTVDMLWSFVAKPLGGSLTAEFICNIALFSGVFFAIRVFMKNNDISILTGAFKEIPPWMIGALLLFELTCYYKEFGISARWYDFLYAVSACMIFVCIMCLVFKIFRLIYTQNMILTRLNELLISSENTAHSDEALRSFRHDYKNHLIVINSMFRQGDIDGAKEYFEKLQEDTGNVIRAFSTGNSVVNSLLDIKSVRAASDNTKIVFSGILPDKGIDSKDMCIIVGNLIDNAVEACEKLSSENEKIISVEGIRRKNTMILTVTNPCNTGSIRKNGKNFMTSKSDKKAHGIGLRNVKSIAEKYGGALTLNHSENSFCAQVMMEINE